MIVHHRLPIVVGQAPPCHIELIDDRRLSASSLLRSPGLFVSEAKEVASFVPKGTGGSLAVLRRRERKQPIVDEEHSERVRATHWTTALGGPDKLVCATADEIGHGRGHDRKVDDSVV